MANVSVLEALLAGASGLMRGVNARRARKEAAIQRASDQSRADLQQQFENRLAERRAAAEEAYKQGTLGVRNRGIDLQAEKLGRTIAAQAERTAAMLTASGNALEGTKIRAGAARDVQASRERVAGMAAGNRTDISNANREMSSVRGRRASLANSMRVYQDQAMSNYKLAMSTDTPTESVPGLLQAAQAASDSVNVLQRRLNALDATPTPTVEPAPPPAAGATPTLGRALLDDTGDGDGPDGEGATEDAVETGVDGLMRPVDQQGPMDQFSSDMTLGRALAPKPARTDSLPPAGAVLAPTHTPGGVPPEIMDQIRAGAAKYGLREGTGAYNKYVSEQMISYQRWLAAQGGNR